MLMEVLDLAGGEGVGILGAGCGATWGDAWGSAASGGGRIVGEGVGEGLEGWWWPPEFLL